MAHVCCVYAACETSDHCVCRLACGYLSHVIESDVIRHHILSAEASQLQAVHVWFRCLAELDHTPSATPTGHASPLQQLTYQLHKLPAVTTLLGNQTTPTDPMSMLQQLLEAMERLHMVCTFDVMMMSWSCRSVETGGRDWRVC